MQCAVDIQSELQHQKRRLVPRRAMEFRIGINLGDVIVEGERIYGDGVNIAARLESLAEPGGVCISGTVYDQVENKLGSVTSISASRPSRTSRSRCGLTAYDRTQPRLLMREPGPELADGRTPGAAIGVGALLLVSVSVILNRRALRLFSSRTPIPPQKPPVAARQTVARRPTVWNMSDDPEQEYFSDGLTEDLITDLSKVPGLFVIARNSAFTYKGKPKRAEQIGRELGVRYILEGSARKGGDQVRITAQLVDATNGLHVWAEHYDEPLNNTFKLQDEIRQKILFALKVKLSPEEQERFKLAPTNNMEAYDLYLRGIAAINRLTSEQNREARTLCTQATILDPNYSAAYCVFQMTYTTPGCGLGKSTPRR